MTPAEKSNDASKAKMDELYAHYEAVRSSARQLASERKDEIQRHIDELDRAKEDLEAKWDRVQNFGDEAVEELNKAFFSSAEAFSTKVNDVKKKIS